LYNIDPELPISSEPKRVDQLRNKIVLVKFGGNAMVNDEIKQGIVADIIALKKSGAVPVIVHGGGPAIRKLLDEVGIDSEFVEGHRKTDSKTMGYVEMALSGSVNSEIVHLINSAGLKAVGLSGKDGKIVVAKKRTHRVTVGGREKQIDLGHVGDVAEIDTALIVTLIKEGYIPVISPVAAGEKPEGYNINADMFAGHMAGALKASRYVALTNVDGIQIDPDDSDTLIKEISQNKAEAEIGKIIKSGMIPKVESCIIALKEGVESAHIVNGTKKHSLLLELFTGERSGTKLVKS